MPVKHPLADRDAAPAAVTVGTTTYTIDADGVVECPPERVDAVADALADAYDRDADALLDGAAGDDTCGAECQMCGQSHDDGACWDLIDEGVCPWCDEYEGENVGMHASRAHPDDWERYSEA
jgi:hypothetical protein